MTDLTIRSYAYVRRGLDRIGSVWLLAAIMLLSVLVLDSWNFNSVITTAASALIGTLPYIVIAVLLIAYLKASGAESHVVGAFEGRECRMIILAAIMGGLAPFCSCEVIPFIAGLLAVGAPLSAVMAFWLSSPLIDPPTLLITASSLGWPFAFSKAVVAVGLGLFGGFLVSAMIRVGMFAEPLRSESVASCCGCGPSPFDSRPVWMFWLESDRRKAFRDQAIENGAFLIKWLTFAYIIEALLIHYIPASLIGSVVGGQGLLPILTGALVGAPAYLNSYAAPPLVAGLMEQGMTAGAAMAFMVAGAVSSVPAMAAVWSLVRRSVFVTYMGFGIAGATLAGVIFEAAV